MGMCWNCGRENSGEICYSCGFEVIQREQGEHQCDCDPDACGHGNYVRCDHCGESFHVEDECDCKGATETPFTDFEQQLNFAHERRRYLENLLQWVALMEEAAHKKDAERLEKLQRDFNHVLGQMEWVGKRS